MKYLIFSLAVFCMVSCSKLEDFTVSDCIRKECQYGVSIGSYYDGKLVINYGTGDLCQTKYWGDIIFRNDSLILIAKKNFTGASCHCGYILTYTIKDVADTCDLNIGFEKDYADFVKRVSRRNKSGGFDKNMSERQARRWVRKMCVTSSKLFYKKPKDRRKYRKENCPKESRDKTKKSNLPFDDVYF